jgi:hypothetical protein
LLTFLPVTFIDGSDDEPEDFVGVQGEAEMDDGSDGASVQSTPSRSKKKRQNRTNASPSLSHNKADEQLQLPPSAQKGKRTQPSPNAHAKHGLKKFKTTKRTKLNKTMMAYTIESIKLKWSEETEYGVSFRAMTVVDQQAEVERLNKGVEKGMKNVIKTKLLDANYTKMIADKLQAHLSESRASQVSMFHAASTTRNIVTHDINFISVGEWVEVDADRSPGFNSEGGIAVIINVHDALADVKYAQPLPK